MSPLSSDPRKRERQLANLSPRPPAPPPENQRARKHGGYGELIREPGRVSDLVREVYDALSVDAPLRGPDGDLPRADDARVQLAAECRVRLDDVGRWLGDYGKRDPSTGKERQSLLDLERRLRNEMAGHLDALGLSPAARAKLGWDVARTAAAIDPALALSEPDAALRREMMRAAGLLPREAE